MKTHHRVPELHNFTLLNPDFQICEKQLVTGEKVIKDHGNKSKSL